MVKNLDDEVDVQRAITKQIFTQDQEINIKKINFKELEEQVTFYMEIMNETIDSLTAEMNENNKDVLNEEKIIRELCPIRTI